MSVPQTCEQLQREIEHELKLEKQKRLRRIKKGLGIALFIVLFVFWGRIKFELLHFFAISSEKAKNEINLLNEPYQKNIDTLLTRMARYSDPDEYGQYDYEKLNQDNLYQLNANEFIVVKTYDKKTTLKLLPMAVYSISGRAVAVNELFGPFMNNFDEVALFDIGIVWGKSAQNTDVLKHCFKFKSAKYLGGSRVLTTRYKESCTKFVNERSHTHAIPANRNVLSALKKIKLYEKVKLDGYLVDIYSPHDHYRTSLSRNDDIKGRGNGNCEGMYVLSVQIGNKIYK